MAEIAVRLLSCRNFKNANDADSDSDGSDYETTCDFQNYPAGC